MLFKYLILGRQQLNLQKYDEFSWKYMVEIAEYLKEKYPHIPVIMFPKGISAFIERGLVYGNFDVFGVDWEHQWR